MYMHLYYATFQHSNYCMRNLELKQDFENLKREKKKQIDVHRNYGSRSCLTLYNHVNQIEAGRLTKMVLSPDLRRGSVPGMMLKEGTQGT